MTQTDVGGSTLQLIIELSTTRMNAPFICKDF